MSYIRRDMLKFLTSRVENLEGLYGFSRTNGFGQSYGKGEDINRLYGEWAMCITMIDCIENGEFETKVVS